MEKKKTAVDWLVDQLPIRMKNYLMEEIEKAKKMERENIESAWHDGNLLGRNGWVQEEYNTGQQYYNETYGNSKRMG